MRHFTFLLASAFLAAPTFAQPVIYLGGAAGYVGDREATGGVGLETSAGLRWGVLLAELHPLELGYHADGLFVCSGTGEDRQCTTEDQTTLSSTVRASYLLPVHGSVALTAGAGLRLQWYDRQNAFLHSEYATRVQYVPHLAGGVLVGRLDGWNAFMRTEVFAFAEDRAFLGEGRQLNVDLVRATVGVAFPLGRR